NKKPVLNQHGPAWEFKLGCKTSKISADLYTSGIKVCKNHFHNARMTFLIYVIFKGIIH
uniref:Uncharacterized protein n=1 Tax=Cyprinus carpio carpio TaxID=630221 RepID=A0A9J8CCZ8_CYPCA